MEGMHATMRGRGWGGIYSEIPRTSDLTQTKIETNLLQQGVEGLEDIKNPRQR